MTTNPALFAAMLRIKAEKPTGLFTVWTFVPWRWEVIATGLSYDDAMLLADSHGLAKVTKVAIEEEESHVP